MRRQLVSIGKQPKAHKSSGGAGGSGRRKNEVSELFDSLTPAAEYFSDSKRRKRTQPKTYKEEEFESGVATAYEQSEFHNVRRAKFEQTHGLDELLERPATPPEEIEARERSWQEYKQRERDKAKRRAVEYWDQEGIPYYECVLLIFLFLTLIWYMRQTKKPSFSLITLIPPPPSSEI